MNNQEKIEAIKKWQNCGFVHPLTCGRDKCEEKLEPIENYITDEISLICPKCKDYIQEHIPEIVYNINYEQFEKLEDIIYRMREKIDR
ncbi:MAG TPA: hypothetical protein VMZ91_04030 [Candidatus Paceibacterota bacterium]|nr:hypothetical protein [Candidatus Paceibacterota bacterium]